MPFKNYELDIQIENNLSGKRKMLCSAEKTEQGENFTCKEENPKLTSPPTLEVMNMEKSKKL